MLPEGPVGSIVLQQSRWIASPPLKCSPSLAHAASKVRMQLALEGKGIQEEVGRVRCVKLLLRRDQWGELGPMAQPLKGQLMPLGDACEVCAGGA